MCSAAVKFDCRSCSIRTPEFAVKRHAVRQCIPCHNGITMNLGTVCIKIFFSYICFTKENCRYPPRGCHKLNQQQKIEPSVFTEVLETACEDLCDNKRIINFHPLFPLTTTVQRKMSTWKSYGNLPATAAIRVVIIVVRNMTIGSAQQLMPYTMNAAAAFYPMLGFTMVENSLSGNLLAALTGLNFSQPNFPCPSKGLGILDSCPFLWKNFRNLDFVTAYVDQFSLVVTPNSPTAKIFKTNINFLAQPTDYYIPSAFINEKMVISMVNPRVSVILPLNYCPCLSRCPLKWKLSCTIPLRRHHQKASS